MLFRYEMKKVLGRRLMWVFAALALLLSVFSNQFMIRLKMGGYIDAMKEVYARYEGQTATDALAARAKAEYLRYVADHPDDFREDWADEETGEVDYRSHNYYCYAAGLADAYLAITGYETVEERQKWVQIYRSELEAGQTDDGKALTDYDRAYNEAYISAEPTVIRYPGGWFFILSSPGSSLVLILLAWAVLSSLFSGEDAARMAPIVLTAARRRRAAGAKLLAAGCCTLLIFVISYGPSLLVTALTYGLPDLTMPPSQVPQPSSPVFPLDLLGLSQASIPLWQALLRMETVHLAASFGCAALITLCSAALRRPMASLAAAVAVIIAQKAACSLAFPYGFTSVQEWTRSGIAALIALLPANVLLGGTNLSDTLGQTAHIPAAMILGVAVAAAAAALSPRLWLRPRKA